MENKRPCDNCAREKCENKNCPAWKDWFTVSWERCAFNIAKKRKKYDDFEIVEVKRK